MPVSDDVSDDVITVDEGEGQVQGKTEGEESRDKSHQQTSILKQRHFLNLDPAQHRPFTSS